MVRYALDVPRGLRPGDLPLRVVARLRHRSRSLADQQVVCDESKTAVGRAFSAGALDARGIDLNPCEPQPITEITSTTAWLGGPAPAGAPSPVRPRWQRTYELGMALVGEVTEELDEARAVLGAAAAEAPAGPAGDRARGMIDVQLGWVLGRQGRTDEALAVLARARRLLPDAPAAIDAAAADALMRVWRWRESPDTAQADLVDEFQAGCSGGFLNIEPAFRPRGCAASRRRQPYSATVSMSSVADPSCSASSASNTTSPGRSRSTLPR